MTKEYFWALFDGRDSAAGAHHYGGDGFQDLLRRISWKPESSVVADHPLLERKYLCLGFEDKDERDSYVIKSNDPYHKISSCSKGGLTRDQAKSDIDDITMLYQFWSVRNRLVKSRGNGRFLNTKIIFENSKLNKIYIGNGLFNADFDQIERIEAVLETVMERLNLRWYLV